MKVHYVSGAVVKIITSNYTQKQSFIVPLLNTLYLINNSNDKLK